MKQCHSNRFTGVLLIRFFLTVLLLLTVMAGPAAADLLTWTLQGVTLADGGTATGTFTLDTTLYASCTTSGNCFPLTDWNISVTDPGISSHFTPSTSTSDLSRVNNVDSQRDQVDFGISYTGTQTTLPVLSISVPLPGLGTPGTLSILPYNPLFVPSLYDYWVPAYQSFAHIGITQGTIAGGFVSVPEPCTILLLGSGLAGLSVCGRKKFRCIPKPGGGSLRQPISVNLFSL